MEKFLGSWRLVSFEEDGPDGQTVYPYGPSPAGLLVYDRSGWMSVQIMRCDRARLTPGDWQSVPAEEIKSAVEGFTAFFGRFEVDETSHTVVHHVEGHLLPDSVGKSLRREFTFTDDILILRPSLNRRVIWQRIGAAA